jgi:hypothetical protein
MFFAWPGKSKEDPSGWRSVQKTENANREMRKLNVFNIYYVRLIYIIIV